MSEVLEFGGRRFVAGLFWAQPGAEVDRRARRDRAWSVEWGEQTGWVAKQDGLRGVDGVPSLAAQVAAYLETAGGEGSESGWVALLKADNGRFALVRVREGTIGTDGDEVFGDAGTALQSVAAARAEGAEVYGTAGTVTDGSLVVEIDPAVLPDADRRGGLSRGGGGVSASRAVLLSGALLLLVAGGAAAIAPDALFGLLGGGREAAVNVLPQRDPEVSARIDSAALVAACGAALADRPPYMPAWRISGIECHGRFEELELVGLRPELQGRAVMVVRWELQGEYVAALHRRIAEEHLSAWYVASVVERSAWAVVPLRPVLGRAEGEPPLSYLAFRREVDRHLGMQGGQIDYDGGSDAAAVRVVLGHGLSRIAELVDEIPGFEVVSLSRAGGRDWVLKARPVAGFQLTEGLFRELAAAGAEGDAVSF